MRHCWLMLICRDTALPQVASIPDHLRESILRLVQSQAEEEEERERAVAEAHSGGMVRGEDPDEEETLPRVKISGEGDNSDAEEGEGDTANVVDVSDIYVLKYRKHDTVV